MRLPRPERYRWSGRVYDAISLEWPLYRRARAAGIDLLRLRPGDAVLDLGCGTGLNFPLLAERLGPGGLIVGVDASTGMLGQARRRADGDGWPPVTLLHLDAAELDPAAVRALTAGGRGVDGVLSTYALSIVPRWREAWGAAVSSARTGARAAIVDLGLPTGAAAVLAPLARLACLAGGADPYRDPGPHLLEGAADRSHRRLLGGHVHVDAGTLGGPP